MNLPGRHILVHENTVVQLEVMLDWLEGQGVGCGTLKLDLKEARRKTDELWFARIIERLKSHEGWPETHG